jgi:hypothetical protein
MTSSSVGGFAMFTPTTEELTNLCRVVGQIALPWAQFEGSMDMCISGLFTEADKTEDEDGLPVSFKRKIVFLKKKFRHRPELSHLKDESTEIFSEAKILAKIRNDIIHGWVSHYDPKPPGEVTFTKLAVRLEQHYEEAPTYSVDFLIGIGHRCLNLATRMAEFNNGIIQVLEAQDQARKAAGKIPS